MGSSYPVHGEHPPGLTPPPDLPLLLTKPAGPDIEFTITPGTFTVEAPAVEVLDWWDSLTAAAGVGAHDRDARRLRFTFHVGQQLAVVTFEGAP